MMLCRLLSLVLIATATLGDALRGDSAGVGAPAPVTEAMVMRAILSDLAFNAPYLEIDLDAANASPAIDNLVRAKILRIVGKSDGQGLEPRGRLVLMLTVAGERTPSCCKGITMRVSWSALAPARFGPSPDIQACHALLWPTSGKG
jgi:hypothetical protein